jgi:hypothetical protein
VPKSLKKKNSRASSVILFGEKAKSYSDSDSKSKKREVKATGKVEDDVVSVHSGKTSKS